MKKLQQSPLETKIKERNYVNIDERGEHIKEISDFDGHLNINQTEKINKKQSEIQQLRGCINQENEINPVQIHTIKNKQSELLEPADMSCAFENNAYKIKKGKKQRECEKHVLDLEGTNMSTQNYSSENKNRNRQELESNIKPLDTRKKANNGSDNSGMIFSTVVQDTEHDNENKKKRKYVCLEDINTTSSTGGATEYFGCKKRKKKHQEGGDSAGKKSIEKSDLLNNGSSQNVLKNADDTQHKAKRKLKHYSKTKVDSGDVEQDCIPSEQQMQISVGNDITLNSDIQQSFPDTSRKRKKKKPKNLDGAKLIEYYKLLDEIEVLTKKKEAATIDHEVSFINFFNT